MLLRALYGSAKQGRLILIKNGLCRYGVDNLNIIRIYEIISTKKGAGGRLLKLLKEKKPLAILAECPFKYEANDWFARRKFRLYGMTKTCNIWGLPVYDGTSPIRVEQETDNETEEPTD